MLNKNLLLFLLFTLSFFKVNAQNSHVIVVGRIVDSLNKKEIQHGTVTIQRIHNRNSKAATIAANGTFRLELNAEIGDSLYVKVSCMGFNNKTLVFVLPRLQTYDMADIYIMPYIEKMNEVTINGRRALYENKLDKIIYNVALDKSAAALTTIDVLRRTPFISINPFGSIEIKGNTGVKILMNGKETALTGGLSEAFKNLPASNIKQIEVITNPSSKYDGEGVSGIVNIVTFKKPFEGFNGTSFANLGNRNNTVGLDANYGGKKSDIMASVNVSNDYITGNTSYSIFNPQSVNQVTQFGQYKSNTFSQNYSLSYTYSIDTTQSLSFSGNINPDKLKNSGSYQTIVNNPIQSYSQTNNVNSNTTGSMIGIDYIKVLGSDKDFFMGSLAWNNKLTTDDFNVTYSSLYDNYFPVNTQKISELTSQLDFSKSVGLKKDVIIETGLKYLHRVFQSKTNEFGTLFNINQDIYAQYFNIEKPLSKKFSAKMGERLELTNNYIPRNLNINTSTNSYLTLFPYAIIGYTLNASSDIKLGYTKRISRPNLLFLNPFVNNTDPRNVIYGNPNLKPENSNNVNLDYNRFWNRSSLTISAYMNIITNKIERYEIISNDKIQTTYLNLGSSRVFGLSTYFNTNAIKNFSINLGADYGYYTFSLNNIATKHGGKFSFNINDTWNFAKTYSFNAFVSYSTPKLFLQGSGQGSLYSVFILSKNIFHGNGRIGLGIDNPFYDKFTIESTYLINSYTYLNTNNFTGRSFKCNISYSFGQQKRKLFIKANGVSNDDLKRKQAEY